MMRTLTDVTIHRATEPVYNEAGELVEPATEENTATPAWAVRASSSVEFAEGRQNLVVRGVGLFPPETDLSATDELTAVGPDNIMPVRYRVVGLFPVICRRTQRVRHIHADLEAVS